MSDALADVLAAMTGSPPDLGQAACVILFESWRVGYRMVDQVYTTWHRLMHPTPAEAVEALHSRGLWPWEPGDDGAPAWWCEACSCGSPSCAAGVMDAPPAHAALVSVARLGADRLRTIEELARVIAKHAGCVGARLVWRVMTRAKVRDHHERISLLSYAHAGDLATMPMSDLLCVAASRSAWSEEPSDGPPALRDLHRLGVHLIAIDERRVVLAVEEIGGGRE